MRDFFFEVKMNTTEEGEKPLDEIVVEGQILATNTESQEPTTTALVVEESYEDFIQKMRQTLIKHKAAGEEINPWDYIRYLNFNKDNGPVLDWMILNGVLTKSQLDKAIQKIKRQQQMESEIGFCPVTCKDLLMGYVEKHKIQLSPKGYLERDRVVDFNGVMITKQDAYAPEASEEVRFAYEIGVAEPETLEDLRRELRRINADYFLGFRNDQILDEVVAWEKVQYHTRKQNIFGAIKFERGRHTGPDGDRMWEAMERAYFDVQDSSPGFAIAVIKKFMWQVKRKARGMAVTHHLMPVLTGQQGKGKSVFVSKLTRPLRDTTQNVNFQTLTDGKTIDLWRNHILFVDEMGFFSKTDVDMVKNIITMDEVPIRIMKTNGTENVRNQATFIGCSNKTLAQLVRDETGLRRFAELMWTNTPDYDLGDTVDWIALWKSVDENGEDPMNTSGMQTQLAAQQKANRSMTSVETWAREFASRYTKWTKASELYDAFRLWADVKFPGDRTDQNTFFKNMTSYCQNMTDFPYDKKRGNSGAMYQHKDVFA